MEDNQCKCQGTYKEILEKYSKDKSNLIKNRLQTALFSYKSIIFAP